MSLNFKQISFDFFKVDLGPNQALISAEPPLLFEKIHEVSIISAIVRYLPFQQLHLQQPPI
jgi:hypothetical protein